MHVLGVLLVAFFASEAIALPLAGNVVPAKRNEDGTECYNCFDKREAGEAVDDDLGPSNFYNGLKKRGGDVDEALASLVYGGLKKREPKPVAEGECYNCFDKREAASTIDDSFSADPIYFGLKKRAAAETVDEDLGPTNFYNGLKKRGGDVDEALASLVYGGLKKRGGDVDEALATLVYGGLKARAAAPEGVDTDLGPAFYVGLKTREAAPEAEPVAEEECYNCFDKREAAKITRPPPMKRDTASEKIVWM